MNPSNPAKIERVAVVGAGTMGAAIAQHFLMKGLDVVLLDLRDENVAKGTAHIDESLEEAVKRRILSAEKKAGLMAALNGTTDYAALADRQLVVEAVFEDFTVKQTVFGQIEQQVDDQCLIASNTSSFSITELGAKLRNQARFIGIHYFYHAAKNKLVEIIPGKQSDTAQIDRLVNFYYAVDKAPIVVADVYGFAVNRFFVPWLIEATRLLEEGKGSVAFIDRVAVETFNVGMGPFALMNATGVPIAQHAAETLANAFGPMYAPTEVLKQQVAAGQDWNCSGDDSQGDTDAVRDRLLGMTLGVAAQMISEGVASATDTDLGARLGLRWPAGPFELMNRQGVTRMAAVVKEVFAVWGQAMPASFEQALADGGFKVEHVRSHIVGKTGLIEFNRPDALNALNEGVVAQLAACFDALDGNPALDKIVLFGRGKAFVAGADIKFFVDNIHNNNVARTYDFTVDGQQLLTRIEQSTKTTIAFLDGLALGGGLELALACDRRIGTPRLTAAFPETGIGIYPGLGGTQRPTRLIGRGLTKFLVATGSFINAKQALAYGLIDAIVDKADSLDDIAALHADRMQADPSTIEENGFETFDGTVSDALFTSPLFAKYEKSLRQKAPLALKKAMELIDQGAELDLQQGLQLELDGLHTMFATQDALAGLSGIINRQKVTFVGA